MRFSIVEQTLSLDTCRRPYLLAKKNPLICLVLDRTLKLLSDVLNSQQSIHHPIPPNLYHPDRIPLPSRGTSPPTDEAIAVAVS